MERRGHDLTADDKLKKKNSEFLIAYTGNANPVNPIQFQLYPSPDNMSFKCYGLSCSIICTTCYS